MQTAYITKTGRILLKQNGTLRAKSAGSTQQAEQLLIHFGFQPHGRGWVYYGV